MTRKQNAMADRMYSKVVTKSTTAEQTQSIRLDNIGKSMELARQRIHLHPSERTIADQIYNHVKTK